MRKRQVQIAADAMENEAEVAANYIAHGKGSEKDFSRAGSVATAALRNCTKEEQDAACEEATRRSKSKLN